MKFSSETLTAKNSTAKLAFSAQTDFILTMADACRSILSAKITTPLMDSALSAIKDISKSMASALLEVRTSQIAKDSMVISVWPAIKGSLFRMESAKKLTHYAKLTVTQQASVPLATLVMRSH